MKELVVVGTGALARELYCWIRQSELHQNIKFKGFLDRNNTDLRPFGLDKYYLGYEDSYVSGEHDKYIIAISDVNIRSKLYQKLKNKNYKFFNYLHESVVIGEDVQFGEANIGCPNLVLTTNIKIGNGNIFNINTSIGHDVVISSFNTFSSHCDVTGKVTINDNNFFGSRVSVLPESKIGSNNKVAAGSVVYKGIKSNCVYIGNPARKISDNE